MSPRLPVNTQYRCVLCLWQESSMSPRLPANTRYHCVLCFAQEKHTSWGEYQQAARSTYPSMLGSSGSSFAAHTKWLLSTIALQGSSCSAHTTQQCTPGEISIQSTPSA